MTTESAIQTIKKLSAETQALFDRASQNRRQRTEAAIDAATKGASVPVRKDLLIERFPSWEDTVQAFSPLSRLQTTLEELGRADIKVESKGTLYQTMRRDIAGSQQRTVPAIRKMVEEIAANSQLVRPEETNTAEDIVGALQTIITKINELGVAAETLDKALGIKSAPGDKALL